MSVDRLVANYTIPDAGLVGQCRFEAIYHEKTYTYVVKFPKWFIAKANQMKGREMKIYSTVYPGRVGHYFIIGSGDENVRLKPSFKIMFDLRGPRGRPKRIQNRRMAVDER